MRVLLTRDPVDELAAMDWRTDPELVRLDSVMAEVHRTREGAQAAIRDIAEEQTRQHVAQATEDDRAAVAKMLGRTAQSIRARLMPGPSLDAQREGHQETMAACDRRLVILREERERVALAAKQRIAVAIQRAAAPILTQLIPLMEQAVELNTTLERMATLSRGQFPIGSTEAPAGLWGFLPEGSQEPATNHYYEGFGDRYLRWRRFLTQQRYID